MGWSEYAGYSERPTLTAKRLSEIYDLPCPNDDMIHGRALSRELHMAWSKKWSTAKVSGITSPDAINMIDKSTLADMDAQQIIAWSTMDEKEPPDWPCLIDHTLTDEAFHEALAEDGWIHGDPEEDDGA